MKLSELIIQLEGIIQDVGDMDCYTNGEYGIGECEVLAKDHISIGSANLHFDTDHLNIDDSDVVCHIGGY